MAVAENALAYALPRQNYWFTANNQTPDDGNLTGQCVTLIKWFMQDMTKVPQPFSARGHARYLGETLLRQGHVTEVPYDQRKRGDLICYIYGEYGHTGIILDKEQIFESNINVAGVKSKIIDGSRVYASRIGKLSEPWRNKNFKVYRFKTYVEGDLDMDSSDAYESFIAFYHRKPTDAEFKQWIGQKPDAVAVSVTKQPEWLKQNHIILKGYPDALKEIERLKKELANSSGEFIKVSDLYIKKG